MYYKSMQQIKLEVTILTTGIVNKLTTILKICQNEELIIQQLMNQVNPPRKIKKIILGFIIVVSLKQKT